MRTTRHRPEIEPPSIDIAEKITGTWIECGDTKPELAFTIYIFYTLAAVEERTGRDLFSFPGSEESGIFSMLAVACDN
ncbi:MAG: hypothetical protein ACREEV_16225, partial [Dongiaceae bacterium]